MRKITAALFALILAGAIAGCGSGSDAEKTPTTAKATTTTTKPASVVPVDTWTKDFCADVGVWLAATQAASEQVNSDPAPGDIAGAREAITGLFEASSTATQTLVTSLEDGGTPDIEGGEALVDDLIAKFTAFDEIAQEAQIEAAALAIDDAAAFNTAADLLIARYRTDSEAVTDSFVEIDTNYPDPGLNAALTEYCVF